MPDVPARLPVRGTVQSPYILDFDESSVHIRSRVTRDCIDHMSIFAYETVRKMAFDEAIAAAGRSAVG